MDLSLLYRLGLGFILVVSALSLPSLFFFTAPYGRHAGERSGPRMHATAGWLLMEFPSISVFPLVYFQGSRALEPVPLFFCCVWMAHYAYRSVIFPLRVRHHGKGKPIAAVAVGFCFTALNSFVIAYGLSHVALHLTPEWFTDPRFILGCCLVPLGFGINVQSDNILQRLREPGQTGYKIPHGGLYRWVSSPNYLGEIIEWTGFAIATWTLSTTAFAIFTFANLFPRAIAHHRWYREKFPDYPARRRAIVPGIL